MSRSVLFTENFSSGWLNRVQKTLGNTSMKLLLEAGLFQGMHIADIGCGTGHMTSWLARMVGPTGQVYAIDINKEVLDIAQARIDQEGLTNVTFVHSDSNELHTFSYRYDLIYSRLMLMHQKEPFKTMSILKECLNSGGKLVFDECVNGTVLSIPYFAEVIECDRVMCRLLDSVGSPVETGNYLYQYCYNLGFSIEYAQCIQPILSLDEGKELLRHMLRESESQIITKKILSSEEYRDLYDRVGNLPEDNSACLVVPRMVQLIARK